MPIADAISRVVGFQRYLVEAVQYWQEWILLFLKLKRPGYRCPGCGQRFFFYHDRRDRLVRDLSIGRFKTFLVVPQHRIDCDRCGRQRERLPFLRQTARCTRRFERWLFRLTKSMTVKAVANLLHCDRRTVKESEVRFIRALLRKRDLSGIRRIGIDEVSERRGHRYLTLVTVTRTASKGVNFRTDTSPKAGPVALHLSPPAPFSASSFREASGPACVHPAPFFAHGFPSG